jgi:hypothetical protein
MGPERDFDEGGGQRTEETEQPRRVVDLMKLNTKMIELVPGARE